MNALLVQGFIEVVHPSYQSKLWHATLFTCAIIAVGVVINTLTSRWLPAIEIVLLVIYFMGFVAMLVPLVSLGPHVSAQQVFIEFDNGGGWSSTGLSFCVGISGTAFGFLGELIRCSIFKEGLARADPIPTARR